MRGSHGLPPSLLGPMGKRFRRQTVPHLLTPEACPTRIREVLRLVAPLARAFSQDTKEPLHFSSLIYNPPPAMHVNPRGGQRMRVIDLGVKNEYGPLILVEVATTSYVRESAHQGD